MCVFVCVCTHIVGGGYRAGPRTTRKKEKENVVKLLSFLIVLTDNAN